jgi:hypothetical protein
VGIDLPGGEIIKKDDIASKLRSWQKGEPQKEALIKSVG